MKRALSLFVPILILVGVLAPTAPASAVIMCPQTTVHISGCGCGPIIYPGYPIIPVNPIGPVHPAPAIACIIN
jgi:hypothetical protein